jgi:hypothetical protein
VNNIYNYSLSIQKIVVGLAYFSHNLDIKMWYNFCKTEVCLKHSYHQLWQKKLGKRTTVSKNIKKKKKKVNSQVIGSVTMDAWWCEWYRE